MLTMLVVSLEVPSYLGASAVESSGPSSTTPVDRPFTPDPAPVVVEVTYEDVVTEVLGEPESVDGDWVDCSITPCVALTFDDGPGPYTPEILAILDDFEASATFYPVGGQITAWPGMLSLVIDAGHDVGNHTMTHPKLSELRTPEQRDELAGLDSLVVEEVGILPGSFRPPFGDIPADGIADSHQRPMVMWSVDSLDWRKRSATAIVDEVLADVGAGDIILMHELYQRSVNALPEILAGLEERGLTVVSVPELLGPALFKSGIITHVPFTCPDPEAEAEVPQWCSENPDWKRIPPRR
jgi:peptidoglycan/xylan/chitin deacetylase (PgdA/CDA1 family)